MLDSKHRGSTLILVLFTLILLLVLGLALMTRARLGYQMGASSAQLAQARRLAFCGLEDFRAKATRDVAFPASIGDDTLPMTYTESVVDGAGRSLGSYRIIALLDKGVDPHRIYQVEATGLVGDAQVVIVGYLENRPGMRWLGFHQQQSNWFP